MSMSLDGFVADRRGDSRLFEHIGSEKRQHEKIKVIDSPGRTDIRYRVAS
jgi:hypothetical protein